jgi:hypothetical protein
MLVQVGGARGWQPFDIALGIQARGASLIPSFPLGHKRIGGP